MSRRASIAIGALAFLASAIVFAPASLLRGAVDRLDGIAVTELEGTLWHGHAQLAVLGQPVGRLEFRWRASALLDARLGYDVVLSGDHGHLDGVARAGASGWDAAIDGTLAMAVAARQLARYELEVPGILSLHDVEIAGPWDRPLPRLAGELEWGGGQVGYVLAGHRHRADLPPLTGYLDASAGYPVLTVYTAGDPTPLMFGKIAADGVASVGITKQFTKMVGQPWVSSEPDHAVVLEVGEKLF